ncbi:serine/threonine-protein kinase [Nocardioides rubriscoriae]|uniref:serine/threonine-protein kinase n=1 Tax=Nocardioides rubriscoriae TaxID=642762 RepID=UPI001478D56A|nr:serine/threonine-protein kinase [Nocardioides rubriscoriae]
MSLPERLGRLRRVRQLGAGGFATVWLYRDDELRSDVAVKALADNWAQRLDIRERFLEEARILRAADSDHLVRVHDLGETDGTPYFVMTYADLGSLDGGLTGQRWEPHHVVPLVAQAASGLAVLHDQGIIHRDVKPQNLLLRGDGTALPDGARPAREVLAAGRLMVADLGVAKALLHASGLTQVVGTPAYMAPEQVTGDGLDTRADVHALGAVAYHLLTGRVLRDGGFAELVNARPPVPPSALAPLSRAVDDVLLRAVHPRPEERWPDVRGFAVALGEAIGCPVAPSSYDAPAATAPAPALAPTVVRSRPAVPAATSTTTPSSQTSRTPARADTGTRTPPSRVVAVLLVVLVLAATFAASFGVTQLLR